MNSSDDIEQQRRIDSICNEFEEAWNESVRPDFQFWIAKGDEEISASLVRQLLEVDVELRIGAGHFVEPGEYSSVDPSAPDVVAQCLQLLDKTCGMDSIHDTPKLLDTTADDISRLTGQSGKIGPYVLLRKIGEGGMGSVWLAEQQEPIRRQVALKVIRSGSRTSEIISRFQSERQALARMDHSNIARILDAGTTSDHQPYFAMELVQGMALTTYCDRNRLGIRDRLKLLCDVCAGVHHAHQKGVIHRDLKPPNVLVADVDGRPVPKVIDFGMAKALDNSLRLADQSAFTAIGQVLGTFRYMSPEQACLEEADIDVRTDVFALGIILYELLTGGTPLGTEAIQGQPLLAILEQVRDHEPVKPSSRVASGRTSLSTLAERRRTDSVRLVRTLTGDLDWIVMKALERDLTRRYESVAAFASDIQHYLNDEPVLARSPSVSYRVRKFVRKHRLPVLAGSLLLVVLIAGIVGTAWGMIAAQKRAEGEKLANETAQNRLIQAQEGNRLLLSIFIDLDIRTARENNLPLESIFAMRLVRAAGRLNGELVGGTLEVASLQHELGITLINLGYPMEAIPLLEESLRSRTSLLGKSAIESINSRRILAGAFASAENWDRAFELFREAYQLARSELDENHPLTFSTLYGVAKGLENTGKPGQAIPLMEESVRLSRQVLGINSRDTLAKMWGLATLYEDVGQYGEALSLYEETWSLMKVHLGEKHTDTLAVMFSLAMFHHANDDFALALPLLEDAWQFRKERLGPGHRQTLATMNNLAGCRVASGLGATNIAFCAETLEAVSAEFGTADYATLTAMEHLAMANHAAGNHAIAKSVLEQMLFLCETHMGKMHGQTQMVFANLGRVCLDGGYPDEAIERLKEVQIDFSYHAGFAWAAERLRKACLITGRFDEFRKLADQHLLEARNFLPDESPELADVLAEIAGQFETTGDFPRTGDLLRECILIREKCAPDSWPTFHARSMLGGSLVKLNRFEEAEPLLVDGYNGLLAHASEIPADNKDCIRQAIRKIVLLMDATGRPDQAGAWREKLESAGDGW